jgi:hypothetical protein
MSTRSGRQAPPPVVDTNPPRPPRPAPPADTEQPTPGNSVAQQQPLTATVTNTGTNVGTSVPGGSPWGAPALSVESLLHGRVNPEDDRGQTGVRLPRYVTDAVRAVAHSSRGKLSMQDIVTAAVKAHLPGEVLTQAWAEHGGPVDEHGNPIFS